MRCFLICTSPPHRLLRRVLCSADVAAPLNNAFISTADHVPAHAVTGRSTAQYTAATRVVHAPPQQPPGLHDHLTSAEQQPEQCKGRAGHQQRQQWHQLTHLDAQLLQQPPQQVLQPDQAVQRQLQQQQAQQPSSRTRRAGNFGNIGVEVAVKRQLQLQQQQQDQVVAKPARSHRRMHSQALLKYKPCERGGSLKHATAICKHLSQGRQLLLPAGSGMQLARGVTALATGRTLMLGHSSAAGLAFQPSFPAAESFLAAEAAGQAGQCATHEVQAQKEQAQQESGSNDSSHTSTTSSSINGNGSKRPAGDSNIMMFVTSLPEAQLRRFEQRPLIAARYGSQAKLSCAVFARVCQQGFTAVRAAGPDALAVALHAVTLARRKLLGCGLDLAVVPITEFVDVDSLAGLQSQQQFAEYDGDEQLECGPQDDSGRQCVRLTVLHVMRCQPQQPWRLLPWPPAPEQLPAVQWQQQLLEQQQQKLQQLEQVQQQAQHKEQQLLQPEERWQILPHLRQWQPATNAAADWQAAPTAPWGPDASVTAGQAAPAAVTAAAAPSSVSRRNSCVPFVHADLRAAGAGQPDLDAVAGSSCSSNASDQAGDVDGSFWTDSIEAMQGYPVELVESEGEQLELQAPGHSHTSGVVPRQPAASLLQKQRKGNRQLVAAAQSAGHATRGGCSSGAGCGGSSSTSK